MFYCMSRNSCSFLYNDSLSENLQDFLDICLIEQTIKTGPVSLTLQINITYHIQDDNLIILFKKPNKTGNNKMQLIITVIFFLQDLSRRTDALRRRDMCTPALSRLVTCFICLPGPLYL